MLSNRLKGLSSFHYTELCSNNPENLVRSIPERWLDSSVSSHVLDMQLIRNACTESYRYSTELPPAFRTEMHFARRHVYRLKDVMVHPSTGACSAGGKFFQESYGSLRRCLLEKPFPSSGSMLHLRGPATCVHVTGFYHFLLEEVPRLLWTLERFPDVKVCLADSAPKFYRDILDLVVERGITNDYETIKSDSLVKMDEYVFTQAEAYSGFVHSSDIRKLRETFMPHCGSVSENRGKIYISRRHSARAFDNEAEFEETITELGYQVVRLEQMIFADQMSLLQKSDTIVAPHGAGLANLLWCNPETNVVEIFSPRYTNDCYARLCSSLELNYVALWATDSIGWGYLNIDQIIYALNEL